MGTWNVNGKQPGIDNVQSWLKSRIRKTACTSLACEILFLTERSLHPAGPPDIISVNIQELVQLTSGRYIYGDMEGIKDYWETLILGALEQLYGVQYILLSSSRVGALVIFVFIHPVRLSIVREVKTTYCKVKLSLVNDLLLTSI